VCVCVCVCVRAYTHARNMHNNHYQEKGSSFASFLRAHFSRTGSSVLAISFLAFLRAVRRFLQMRGSTPSTCCTYLF